ncbi:MAG: prolyl oligopeptidase family serine peptidase [Acidimicrobiales bacterium]
MPERPVGKGGAAAAAPSVPQWPFVSADGKLGGFVRVARRGAWSGSTRGNDEGIYVGPLDGVPQRLSCRPPSAPPALDSSGRRLLLSHEVGDDVSRISLARLGTTHRNLSPLAEIPGSVQQLCWDEQSGRALALAAEPGADTASLTSGRRRPHRALGPEVDGDPTGPQRVWSVSLATGRAAPVGPPSVSIWEMALFPDASLACVCSSEPGEAGWYRSFIARLDLATGALQRLFSPEWQVAGVSVAHDGERLAFVEGWASDRGLVAGRVVVLRRDGGVERPGEDPPADATWVQWDRHGRLFFAGWQDLGTCWGYVRPGGGGPSHYVPAALVGSPWRPSLAISAGGEVVLACRSDETTPPEVVTLVEENYKVWAGATQGPGPGLSVVEGAWAGAGGEEIHGILLLPTSRSADEGNAASLVVVPHGGPTIAYHHAFDPARANLLLDEGFSVLLPNPRGSVGRGASFARANHGDPGGKELEDVMAGASWAAGSGMAPEGKPAVMGSSYGGYLSALAATTRSDQVAAAVVGAGISDIASCRHTCNNAPFYDLLLGGLPAEPGVARLCVARSAVFRAGVRPAPALIVHGQEDRCVPVAQAHELFNALRAAGGEVELATYPREGHQLSEPDHLADYWARVIRWLSSHRSAAGAGMGRRP